MKGSLTDLSKTISHALRHDPWLYELELDAEGWVPVESLLQSLRETRTTWRDVTEDDLRRMMQSATKQRFELNAGRIRALYGHSVPDKLAKSPSQPPPLLHHGTAPDVAAIILLDGLKPMSRQYVHLSVDRDTALEVGRRKSDRPVLLLIDSAAAHDAGVPFYKGNDKVWLADHVPAQYIRPT